MYIYDNKYTTKTTPQMKCFIASAFGYQDVDKVYTVVKRVLKSFKITPLRVDQIDHNKKIDQKIIELIDQCDFGIADLTYARPSVYYEAGRIHGLGKEVIFTTRSDHFRPKPDDTFGNHRLHFDLITENVIGWSDKTTEFETRLKRRIEKVIRPLIKQAQEKKKVDEEQASFKRLSLTEKHQQARVETIRFIQDKKFKLYNERFWNVVGCKNKKNTIVVLGDISHSYSGRDIHIVYERTYSTLRLIRDNGYNPKEIIVLIVSVTKITESTIHKSLMWFSRAESPLKEYHYRSKDETLTKLIVIDDIKSQSDLSNRLKMIFKP